MIHFIQNIGEYFASNYFDEDFVSKVIEKSGYSRGSDAIKQFNSDINGLRKPYLDLKQSFMEKRLRTKDKITETHRFHTKVLNALGYDAENTNYANLYPVDDNSVLPVRHILYRGDEPHLMVMEMNALIKVDEEEPDGLFEQQYNIENEDETTPPQKYHRSQWDNVFKVPEGVKVSPMVINKAISELFLLPQHRRPKFILLCAGNQYFLLEGEPWFRGSYLQLDLEMLFDDAAVNRDYYSLFYLLLAKDMLAPKADMVLLDQLNEDSHKKAYEVTKDLKEGVINAVEKLANEAVYYLKQTGTPYTEIDASKLKDDCLTMVYRLLFLFYAESREDLDILPTDDEIYQKGYSLEMLRDLEQVPLITESGKNGYFFHDSLYGLFHLLSSGFRENNGHSRSFRIRHLDSPMFDNRNLHYLPDVKIRNFIWQDVICELSLSKKVRGKNRGRISYANLGINQLGSVYESLLAFRGFLAETEYIEVHRKRKGNETSADVVRKDGSFLVPRHRMGDFENGEVYYENPEDREEELRVIPEGTFIYRLSGRDRQKSASYYTPEVLTQTTVKYTLKPILEKLDNGEIEALDLLDLKILEPAMGAAAFHNEAIDQIAEAYLTYRQEEMNQKVEPDKYREELQKIKAYIALNNVYGVDLNPTAIELGKLSLWLNVIHKDMQTPFFGYRLGVGNAVVGAWLKVYNQKDFSFEKKGANSFVKKSWWDKAPKHLKFGKKGILRREDEIYHFLLPDPAMASSGDIKLLKDEYPKKAQRIREWRAKFTEPLRADEGIRLQQIARAVDMLLLEHYELQNNISLVTESNPSFFGNPNPVMEIEFEGFSYEQKQKFAEERLQPNAPYHKLKQIFDYWCALWFWDVRDAEELPTRTEWYDDLVNILNIDLSQTQNETEEEETAVTGRKDKRKLEAEIREKLKQSTTSLFTNRRAELVQEYAAQYRFFHYELEFIEVFREKNGFDLAVGNPPWVEIAFDEAGVVSEFYPEVYVKKMSSPKVKSFTFSIINNQNQLKEIYISESLEAENLKQFIGAFQNYPLLDGHRGNLYKCVLENGLHWISEEGYLGLIHPQGVYDDPNGEPLRKKLYERLKYNFQFINELVLFAEVHHNTVYGINIYSGKNRDPNFFAIFNLFHPSTIDGSFISVSTEVVEGYKRKNKETGNYEWNTLPHSSRIIHFTPDTLKILAKTFENSDNWQGTKLVSIHTKEMIEAIKKIGYSSKTINNFSYKTTDCWNEVNAINDGFIKRETKYPEIDKYEMIYSGPHVFVGNSMYKSPREVCVLNSHYDVIDFTKIDMDYIPRTNYIPVNITAGYESLIKGFQLKNGSSDNWLSYYKIAFRKMLSQPGERTLAGAIIPPKSAHVNNIISVIFKNHKLLLEFNALTDSLVFDFYMKTIGKSNLYDETISKFPLGISDQYKPALFVRTLQLNCLNKYYAPLWEENFEEAFTKDNWSIEDKRLKPFSTLEKKWSWATPLRNYFERRQALVEIDVITAMALGISLEELILMYNIQFPVLQQNEDDTWYDTRGNIVFTCSRGLTGVGLDRPDWENIKEMKSGETYEHTIEKSELYQGEKVTYYAPFTKQDRVEDYKTAWRHFEKRFEQE